MSVEPTSRRPAFARDFPREPDLDALVTAFARGNYAAVRSQAPALVSGSDPAIAQAARTLIDRTAPDRTVIALLGATTALLVLVAGYWIVHGHAPPGSAATPLRAPAGDVK